MQDQKQRVGTTHYTMNSISNLRKIRHTHTDSDPRKQKHRTNLSLHQELNPSTQLAQQFGFSTELALERSTKTQSNSFKCLEFGIKTGGTKVDHHFENRIRPIRSYGRQTKSSMTSDRHEKDQFESKRPLVHSKQRSSILDKSNLFLIPFLKNKVKRLTKYLDKTNKTNSIIQFGNNSCELRVMPVEYSFRAVPLRSTSLLTNKRYSGIRTHKHPTEIKL